MKKLSTLLISLFAIWGWSAAYAGTATGNFTVQINFTNSCTVTANASPATFTYTSGQGSNAALGGTTSFGITCTSGVPYTLALDAGGTGYTGSFTSPTGSYTDTSTGLNYTLTLPTPTAGTGALQSYTMAGSMVSGQGGTCGTVGGCTSTNTHTITVTF